MELQSVAPPLGAKQSYHVFFIYHPCDREWVQNIADKLESPGLGFRCCLLGRDLDPDMLISQKITTAMKASVRTIIVLSPEFIHNLWPECEYAVTSNANVPEIHKDILLVRLQVCETPEVLAEAYTLDTCHKIWWSRLLSKLCSSDDTPMTEETVLSMSSSLMGLNPDLQSGHLLVSLRSQCQRCGHEVIDVYNVPDELLAHGIQIPAEEYRETMKGLMDECRFRWHVWCYSIPLAMVVFTLLLVLCLTVIPVMERRLESTSFVDTGLEFVHGTVVWLCLLTLYLLVTHLCKRKMEKSMNKKLMSVNSAFLKYNILVGVEDLGLGDWNKYYIHYFYFEMGPCLATLQELLATSEDAPTCFVNECALAEPSIEMSTNIDTEEQMICPKSQFPIQNGKPPDFDGVDLQNQAEDMLLEHSSNYINMLITKRLLPPQQHRHVLTAPCLCQFVEQKVFKLVV